LEVTAKLATIKYRLNRRILRLVHTYFDIGLQCNVSGHTCLQILDSR